jgi:hypothetical protein
LALQIEPKLRAVAEIAAEAHGSVGWLQGEHLLKYYESPRGYLRGFCSACGSPVINRAGPNWKAPAKFPDRSPQYGVALALLDDPQVAPELHCFTGSKAPWFEITDDLPRYAEYPPPG